MQCKAKLLANRRRHEGLSTRGISMKRIKLEIENRNVKSVRKFHVGLLSVAAILLSWLALTPTLRADDAQPPARAVRLSNLDGQLAQGKQVLAPSAVANTPLFEGTVISTGDDGRAEVQFEDGSVARLSPNSSMTLTALRGSGANGVAEITLESGLGYFELQGAGQSGEIKVEFGDSVVAPSGFSVLRISMDTPPGELAVFSGNAHLERGSAVTVECGRRDPLYTQREHRT